MSMAAVPSFKEIQKILDRLVNGRWDLLEAYHGDGFGWKTKQQLQAVIVRPGGSREFRLIDPDLARQGRGRETNLVVALVRGVGGFSQMPKDGPYATTAEIDSIVAW